MAQSFLSGLALGAGLLWFLDPRRGGQRRSIVRDKMKHVAHELEQAARVGSHDFVHRVEGVRAEFDARRRPTPADGKLEERVRSELGRICSHTRTIHVHAEGHRIRLEGPVLATEAEEIVQRVARMRGVEEIENHLEAHADASGVPSLQGEHVHHRPRRLPPAAHLVLGGASGAFGIAALIRGSVAGFALGTLGAIANAHAIVSRNRPFRAQARSTAGRSQQQQQQQKEPQKEPQQAGPARPDVVQGAAPPGVR
ncbi:MAG TPA: hypothetical protein VMI75_20020 [Polyangiaceae bacterium]|nr:hypothetical protein [Polyangiaceae bacterium]